MDHGASQRAARLLVLQTEDHAAANYDGRIPGFRAVHLRPGQAHVLPTAGSGPSLMFPRPRRPVVGSAQPLPRRARASRLAVDAQPDAQRSPCVSRRGPDGASGLRAPGGDVHNSHFRSPMSRPARPPQRPRGQEGGGGGRHWEQEPGPGPPRRARGPGVGGGAAAVKCSCPQW